MAHDQGCKNSRMLPQVSSPESRSCDCNLQVVEETVADDDVLMIKGCKNSRAVTVLLRGANDYLLDEMDRSLHDAFCIVKRVLESGAVVPGGCRTLWMPPILLRQCRKSHAPAAAAQAVGQPYDNPLLVLSHRQPSCTCI